jgi:hypothetical protein
MTEPKYKNLYCTCAEDLTSHTLESEGWQCEQCGLAKPECFGSQDASISEGFPYDCRQCEWHDPCQNQTLQDIFEDEFDPDEQGENWRFQNSRGRSVFKKE